MLKFDIAEYATLIEQRLRDCLGLEFTDSTAQIMKIVIPRELMGRVAVPY